MAALSQIPAPAAAQLRTIPADAKRGTLTHVQGMTVDISGRRMQLAAGGQIRDDRNMVLLPAAVPPGMLVKFTLDNQGQVARVWILTPQEAAQPDAKK
jgi:hypothetical protein